MKLVRRPNRADALILLLLVTTLSLTALHLVRLSRTPEQRPVTLTFAVRGVLPEIADAIESAEKLSLEGILPLCSISVERTPAKLSLSLSDGTHAVTDSTLREDVTLTLDGEGVFSPDGFLLSGRRPLCPGMSLTLLGDDLTLSATLVRILPTS